MIPTKRTLAGIALWSTTCIAPLQAVEATQWTIEGEQRQAVVIPPSKKAAAAVPLIFVFHGHGGTMQSMERKGFQKLWPEALVVCPQGLPTVSAYDPTGQQAGWQKRSGLNHDRDLKFFDALLKTLREKYKVDDRRIYATGHSNGGGFVYLLGVARNRELAALAPVAAGAGGLQRASDFKPLPVLHIAGEQDEVVPFANQQRTMAAIRRLNGCDAEGQPWARAGSLVGTLYPSKIGAPFVAVIHPGTHKYPDEAPELIVKFFKSCQRK